jgi:Fumarylacetoacetate (FAA) hydrolase family
VPAQRRGDAAQPQLEDGPLHSRAHRLSELIVELLPGDVIFTGTPSGIGMSRTPPRYLSPGDRLESWIEGIGSMSHTFVAGVQLASERLWN